MLREQSVTVGEHSLNLAYGPPAGPPLLLLHGVTRLWQDFVTVMPTLACRWQVHGLDFRGHGRSSRATGYRVVDYVGDVASMIRARFENGVILYGHSLGAMVAAAVAAEVPDRVRGLVLEDPPFDTLGARIHETPFYSMFRGMLDIAERGGTVATMTRALAEMPIETPSGSVAMGEMRDGASLRFSARCLVSLDPRVLQPIVAGEWLEGYRRDDWLRGIRCPTLLLQADYASGGMLPDADAEVVAQLIPECYRVRVPGAGHLLHWQQNETTLQLVGSFLESLFVAEPPRD